MEKRKVMQITSVAVLVALSIVLSLVVLFRMPQGGSVTLYLVPLLIIAKKYGFKVGVLAAILYGTINMIMGSSYIVSIGQILLDYYLPPIILMLFSIKSMNKKIDVFTILFLSIFSFTSHVISGMVFYGVTFEGSLIYNVTYFIPTMILNVIVYYLIHDRVMKNI